MTEDIVRKLGLLCLGTRFKRIGERMQGDVARFVEASGLAIQPGQYPLLAALDANGPLTVSELVEALGISQPGVTRNVTRLVDLGLVDMSRDRADQRHKAVALTAQGHQAVDKSKRELWPHIEAAVADLCAGLSGPLLTQLGKIEDGLAQTPLDRRATAAARHSPAKKVKRTRAAR